MKPIASGLLNEVRLGLDRPEHPLADKTGRLWVTVRRAWRGKREVVEAQHESGGVALTSEEISVARGEMKRREERNENGESYT